MRYKEGEHRDILGHLVYEVRKRGHPLFESFVSRSSKIQSLYTNPSGSISPILFGAPKSLINQQMRHLADEVLTLLDAMAHTAVTDTAAVVWGNRMIKPPSA